MTYSYAKKSGTKTLGEKIIKLHTGAADDPLQDLIQTSDEVGRAMLKKIEKIIETHKDYADKYWIVNYHKPVHSFEQCLFEKIIIRKSPPELIEGWGMIVYSYDNKLDALYFEGVHHLKGESAQEVLTK